jgi:hypothetical protein
VHAQSKSTHREAGRGTDQHRRHANRDKPAPLPGEASYKQSKCHATEQQSTPPKLIDD